MLLASALTAGLTLIGPNVLLTAARAAPSRFDSEQPAGLQIDPKHQSNWEPTVATDPNHPSLVYQLITGINAHECSHTCPGTSVLLRKSSDGGTTWGPETFVCGIACKGIGWQFDPQIKVANDTDPACGCGTVYVAFMDTYDPGVQLFKSYDGGDTWSTPVTMNGGLNYMDKPVLVISPSGKDVYVAFNHKLDSMVVASHDYGQTFLPPQQVNGNDRLWWYANGGAIAPNGDVYFSLDGETGTQLNVGSLDGPDKIAVLRCSPDPNVSCGNPTTTSFGTSAAPPPCTVFQCYPDYFAATASIAIDSSGHMVLAYTFSTVTNGPKSLHVRTSDDGVHWEMPTLVNDRGDSNVPQIANAAAGDFRLAWQDNRTSSFDTWFARSTNGGSSWGSQVRLSNLPSGAPYKSSAGYTFTDGDYFGLAVNSLGVNFVIWGEADGSSIYCCGDVWYTKRG